MKLFAAIQLRPASLVRFVFALCLAVGLAGCSSRSSQPADTRAADADAIRAADAAWNTAMQTKDVEKSVSFYADDAILLVNKDPAMQSRDLIRKEFQKMFRDMSGTVSFTNLGVEVARSGDIAWDHGTYEFKSTDKAGHAMSEKGKYLTVWKKQADGEWKAVADMDNEDQ